MKVKSGVGRNRTKKEKLEELIKYYILEEKRSTKERAEKQES